MVRLYSVLFVAVVGESERTRCVGHPLSDPKPVFPRLHHPFLLFGGLNLAQRTI